MNKVGIILAFLLPLSLFSNTVLLEVVKSPIEVTPGEHETFIVKVNNDTTVSLNLEPHISTPNGWRVLSQTQTLTIHPGESKNILFVLAIDKSCNHGITTIEVNLTDPVHNFKRTEVIETTVTHLHQLQINPVKQPDYVVAGDTLSVKLLVRNNGNCVEELDFNSSSSAVRPKNKVLNPGETVVVELSQNTPSNLTQATFIASDLTAGNKDIKENYRLSTRIYPSQTAKTDPYHRFPIQASYVVLGVNTQQQQLITDQFEISGAGHLDRGKNFYLEFIARGPDQLELNRIGNYDQYGVRMKYKNTELTLGDFSYGASPLLEMRRFGRGLEFKQGIGRFSLGGFYSAPRFFPGIEDQYLGYVDYQLSGDSKLRGSYMKKNLSEAEQADLVSTELSITKRNFQLRTEFAGSTANGQQGLATSGEFYSRWEKLKINTSYVLADKNYRGFYSNTLFLNSNLAFSLKKWNIITGVNYNSSNLALDTFLLQAPETRSFQIGGARKFRKKSNLQVSAIRRSRIDRFGESDFNYRESTVRSTFTTTTQKSNLQVMTEGGFTENRVVGQEGNNLFVNLQGKFGHRPLKWLYLEGFVNYIQTNRYSSESEALILYGGRTQINFRQYVTFFFQVQNNYLPEEYFMDRSLTDAGLNLRIANHELSLSASRTLLRGELQNSDLFFRAKYTLHINAPLNKLKGLGSLSGTIVNSNGEPLPDVVLNFAGYTVMSDDNGAFKFNDIPQGSYFLTVDLKSLPMGAVLKEKLPMNIAIGPSQNAIINLHAQQSGGIEGKINFQSAEENTEFPKVIIELKGENGTLYTVSDSQGAFNFKRIPPGEYNIRVVPNGWREKYNLSLDNFNLVVAESEVENIIFDLTPKKRIIKFNQGSFDLKVKQ